MAGQITKQRPTTKRAEEAEQQPHGGSEKNDKLKAEIDDLLDEIDSVLEENAEEFVRQYIQKGGE